MMDVTKLPGASDVWRAVMALCEVREVLALERVCSPKIFIIQVKKG